MALTEARFVELLQAFEKRLDIRFEKIETRLDKVEKQIKDLRGFQDHESKSIELDLQMLLKKYLLRKYPMSKITSVPMKQVYNPKTHKRIKDLDVALLVSPHILAKNTNEFAKELNASTFVLAEAKHTITRDKIKIKLNQFIEIRSIFHDAKEVVKSLGLDGIRQYVSNINPETKLTDPTYLFYQTILHNQYILNIQDIILFFGAAHWDPTLLDEFQKDIRFCKNKMSEFTTADASRKMEIYKKTCKLQEKWSGIPSCSLDFFEVQSLQILPGLLQYCETIVPSGERYTVVSTSTANDVEHTQNVGNNKNILLGINYNTIGGKHQTRKNKVRK